MSANGFAARAAGFSATARAATTDPEAPGLVRPLWLVPGAEGEPGTWDEHFVDFQRDHAVKAVMRSLGAGMRSVEHVKRYTSISTANDQGKTSAVNAIGAIASVLGEADDLGQVGGQQAFHADRHVGQSAGGFAVSALAGGAERVDTRVVQVLYSFDPVRHSAYLGQRMDVFVDAPRTATSTRSPRRRATGSTSARPVRVRFSSSTPPETMRPAATTLRSAPPPAATSSAAMASSRPATSATTFSRYGPGAPNSTSRPTTIAFSG